MAEVHQARRIGPRGFSKPVALKRLHPALAADPRVVRMFCTEARIQASLSHPNLVQVIDFGEHDGELYMVMELIDGVNVAELLTSVTSRLRIVDLGPALHLAREVLRGLAYVHGARDDRGRPLGLVHRDVAPSNILVDRSGAVKLADFGIMLGTSFDRCTAPGELKGKIGYVSPEQAMGAPLDGRSDLFSLGVVLAEMLIGQRLFPGRNELEILAALQVGDLQRLDAQGAHLPADVQALLRRALAHRPEHRFGQAQELLDAVEQAQRRNRVQLSDHALVQWFVDLGLFSARSGFRPKVDVMRLPEVQIVMDDPGLPRSPTRPDLPRAARSARQLDAYRVRDACDVPDTPRRLAQLVELVATGRVGLHAMVSRNGGPFLRVGSLSEVAQLATRDPYLRLGRPDMRTSNQCTVRPGCIPELLFQIAAGRRTGLLCLSRGPERAHAYFVQGCPGLLLSTEPAHLLGSWLVTHGVLDTETLWDVLEEGLLRDVQLGAALVARGILRPADVDHALSRQRMARLRALCRWPEGEACFYQRATSGLPPPGLASPLPLLAEAVLGAFTLDQLTWMLSAVRRGPVTLRRDPVAATRALGLPGPESEVLMRADRAPSVDVLLRQLAAGHVARPRTTLRAVLVGLASGALTSEAWPRGPSIV
jgi:serine/threonine-protein kinase